MSDTLFIVAVIAAATAVAEWLGQQPGLHRVGGALMVILLGALMANLGVIPSASDAPPLYGLLISVGAPVSIFLLLLRVDLRALRRAGLPMLAAFALGAVGTVTGVLVAAQLTGADAWLGEFAAPLQGMYVATYVGGSANFNALALHYGLVGQGILFAGANAVDNVVTSLWMAALLVLPALLASWFPTRVSQLVEPSLSEEEATTSRAARPITLFSLAALLALALAAHWVSVRLAGWLAVGPGWNVPAILILTALALVAAQFRAVQRLPGALLLGTYGSYVFLAVIGALCEVDALAGLGHLGLMLALFVGLAVLIHGAVVFGTGLALKLDPALLAVASTANVAGSTTVMPLARSLRRMDLLLPGILVGALGNAVGTYLGFGIAAWLSR